MEDKIKQINDNSKQLSNYDNDDTYDNYDTDGINQDDKNCKETTNNKLYIVEDILDCYDNIYGSKFKLKLDKNTKTPN